MSTVHNYSATHVRLLGNNTIGLEAIATMPTTADQRSQ